MYQNYYFDITFYLLNIPEAVYYMGIQDRHFKKNLF